jgi:tetratricopeptide (TPR) repeat protein
MLKARALLEKAIIGKKTPEDALECCKNALKLNPQNAEAWILKAEILWYLDKIDEAIQCCDKAVELDPRNGDAWSWKGAIFSNNLKNYDDANQYYEKAFNCYDAKIGENQFNSEAWRGKGQTFVRVGKNVEAIECYRRAVELDPQYLDAWERMGATFNYLGTQDLNKLEEAISCWDNIIRLNDGIVSIWSSKGVALEALGRITEAEAAFAKAKELGYKG